VPPLAGVAERMVVLVVWAPDFNGARGVRHSVAPLAGVAERAVVAVGWAPGFESA
jgi:hypothetical protein